MDGFTYPHQCQLLLLYTSIHRNQRKIVFHSNAKANWHLLLQTSRLTVIQTIWLHTIFFNFFFVNYCLEPVNHFFSPSLAQ